MKADFFFKECTSLSRPSSVMPIRPLHAVSALHLPLQNPHPPLFWPSNPKLGAGGLRHLHVRGAGREGGDGGGGGRWAQRLTQRWRGRAAKAVSQGEEPGWQQGTRGEEHTCEGLLRGFLTEWEAQQCLSAGTPTSPHPRVSWTAGENRWHQLNLSNWAGKLYSFKFWKRRGRDTNCLLYWHSSVTQKETKNAQKSKVRQKYGLVIKPESEEKLFGDWHQVRKSCSCFFQVFAESTGRPVSTVGMGTAGKGRAGFSAALGYLAASTTRVFFFSSHLMFESSFSFR